MTDTTLWYTARGSGVVALVLLTIVVALGIASRSGRPAFGLPRFAVQLVHRNASLLAVLLIALHLTTLTLDKYAKVDISDLLVPFIGSYRPFWQGLGTLALLLIVALVATGLLRSRMPERVWRAVHWLAYACWPVAFAHGLGTGTDSGTLWLRLIAAVCALTVAAAVSWRLAPHFAEHSKVRRPLTRRPSAVLGRTR
jgi:methionine sulfoxide reductase heme-binding subunit